MEAPPTRCDVFLSHSGKQKGFVTDLEHELSSMGYSVFFDKNDHSLPPGQPFPPLIFSAAKTCKLGIVVLTDDFLTSYWPMLELCVFADRLLHGDVSGHQDSFTLLPLFYKLSPEDIKRKNNVSGWIGKWMEFERLHGPDRITAAECKDAVMKVLAPRNGIVHDSSRQGDISYIVEVANKIKLILPRRAIFSDPGKLYSGRQRLCQMILDEFRKLELVHPFTNDLHGHVLGMYGVRGSGKSTLCRFLCEHDAIYEEFGENVVYLQLPTKLDPHYVGADSLVLVQEYSKLIPRHTHLASMDLIQARNKLYHARIRHKMFLVLDNISTSNQEHYMTMLQDMMSAAILPLGSKIMLVAQSAAILEDMMLEIARYSTHKHAIIEVPYTTEEEAREIIRNCCYYCCYSGVTHPVFNRSLHFFKRNIPSALFIPFIFEQIGVLLRENHSSNEREPKLEVEMLLKIVSKGKKDAVRELLDINFKQLSPELQVLFFDIALFIIPAGCSQIDEAALILSRMNGATDTDADIMKIEIKKLRKHCALSIIEGQIQIHDIFLEYAKNISGNSTSYVNATWSRILEAGQRSSPGSATVDLKCSDARIINIGDGFRDVDVGDRDINLHLEIGAKSKAVTVRRRDNCYGKCSLLLSGDLSSLVWLQMENLQQVSISLTARGTNLCNLDRLELRNPDKKDIVISRFSSKKRKRMGSLLDFIGRPIIQHWKGMSVSSWPFKPSSPWITYPFASYTDDVIRSLGISGRTTNLRVLILVNAGIRSLEDVSGCCPQLEELEVNDEHHQLMSVSIGSSTPKLKRLVIGKRLQYVRERAKYTYETTRSSKLVLQLGECRELEEVSLDVSSFDRVEVTSPFSSSRLRQFGLLNDRKVEVMGMALVSTCSLSLLRNVVIYCKKVETLDFKQHCLPKLEDLRVDCCNSLTHISVHPAHLPNLQSLAVRCCNKLHVIEGLENLVKEQLQSMSLEFLPNLLSELGFWGVHLQHITVSDCPGVKISYDVLVLSESLQVIHLEETCALIVMGNQLHRIVEELETDGISEHQIDEDVDGTVKFSPNENIIAALTMQNESTNTPGHMLSLQCPDVSPINLQNRLTFWQARDIEELTIHGSFEHLQEIEGIQHLRMLERLYLSNLSSLTRVSGIWPPSMERIRFEKCSRLQEVPRLDNAPKLRRLSCIECIELKAVQGNFRQLLVEEYFEMELVGCKSMEMFPMEDAIEELGRGWDEEYCPLGFVHVAPKLRVWGSKFARVEVMEEWLERAEWNSHLWLAALDCLSWEFVIEGAVDARDILVRYFSSGAPSPQILSEYPHQYHRIILSLEFSYLYLRHQVLPSAAQERLSSLESIMGCLEF